MTNAEKRENKLNNETHQHFWSLLKMTIFTIELLLQGAATLRKVQHSLNQRISLGLIFLTV